VREHDDRPEDDERQACRAVEAGRNVGYRTRLRLGRRPPATDRRARQDGARDGVGRRGDGRGGEGTLAESRRVRTRRNPAERQRLISSLRNPVALLHLDVAAVGFAVEVRREVSVQKWNETL